MVVGAETLYIHSIAYSSLGRDPQHCLPTSTALLSDPSTHPATPFPIQLVCEVQPAAGSWNMAVDEALLEAAVASGIATVRLYRWQNPTVSLGYFQSVEDAALWERFQGVAKVRRLSGGGAILHHHEWTYACCLPATHPLTREPTSIYHVLHQAVCDALAAYGIDTSMRGTAAFRAETQPSNVVSAGTTDQAFLCFRRGDPRDIVFAGHKVLGSAQRRRHGAVLQHGSLILRRSAHAPEIPGLCDLIAETKALDEPSQARFEQALDSELPTRLATEMCVRLGSAESIESFTWPMLQRIQMLQREKYEHLIWPRSQSSP